MSARPGADRSALVAELKKRNLRGFDVTVRIETFKKEMQDPKPGGRLKRLAMEMKVSVVGTTIPEAKLAFNGTGEAAIEAEVAEARLAADTANVGKEVIKDAIKQAVDQAVLKLSMPTIRSRSTSPAEKEGGSRSRGLDAGFPSPLVRSGSPRCSRSKSHFSASWSRWQRG